MQTDAGNCDVIEDSAADMDHPRLQTSKGAAAVFRGNAQPVTQGRAITRFVAL